MKSFLLLITLLFSGAVFAQDTCRARAGNAMVFYDDSVIEKNQISEYLKYNFSELWTHTESANIYGIMGGNHQRMRIKFLKVEKSKENPDEYFVYGKSKVKNKVRNFKGKITIEKIQKLQLPQANWINIDTLYAHYNIKVECLLTAKYEFYEDKRRKNAGVFSGELLSRFLLDKKDLVRYNEWNTTDWYYNNAFAGTWKGYNSNVSEICNWGDYRVPSTNCDFDNGEGGFYPNDKYLKYGWRSLRKCYTRYSKKNGENCRACKKEREKWWK